MSTFLTGVTDAPAQQHLYQPDYQFLATVMGTQQQRYDQGLQQIRSLQNSLLSMPVSNEENERFRQQKFQELEQGLRQTSSVDLSNPANVQKARGLFRPLLEDQDLQYDMLATRHLQQEMSKAEQARMSSDPKIRQQYSEVSRQDLQLAQQSLREGKRGDGSIKRGALEAQQRQWVPFEDTDAYLNEQAQKQGLKIKTTQTAGGYIKEVVNGQGAILPFAEWAASTLSSPRFARQFEVEGRVKAETAIRGIMQQGNLTREQAVSTLAQQLLPKLADQAATTGSLAQSRHQEVSQAITRFQQTYPTGIPQDLAGEYQALLQEQVHYDEQQKQQQNELQDLLSPDAVQRLSGKLGQLATKEAMVSQAKRWGYTRAMATQEEELRSDETYMGKLRLQQADQHFYAAEKRQWAQFGFEQQKFGAQHDLAERRFGLDQKKAEVGYDLEYAKLQTAKDKTKYGEGKAPDEVVVGRYLPEGQQPVVDEVQAKWESGRQNIYNLAFAPTEGVLSYAVPDRKQRLAYGGVLSKLRTLADGGQAALSQAEQQQLQGLASAVGHHGGVDAPRNAAQANALLMNLAGATYLSASRQLARDKTGQKMAQGGRQAMTHGLTLLSTMQQQGETQRQLDDQMRRLSAIVAPGGRISPEYAGARVKTYLRDGTPVLDLSGLPSEKRASLTQNVDRKYIDESRHTGSRVQLHNLQPGWLGLISPGSVSRVVSGGKDVSEDFQRGEAPAELQRFLSLPAPTQQKLIGSYGELKLDPVSRTATLVLRQGADVTDKELKGLKLDLQVTIPYQKVLELPGLQRYHKLIQENTIDYSPLGAVRSLREQGSAKAPQLLRAAGYDYQLMRGRDAKGNPGVHVLQEYENPYNQQWDTSEQFLPLDLSDPQAGHSLEEYLTGNTFRYADQREAAERQQARARQQQAKVPASAIPSR